jgi:hypothetical protein
MRQVQWEAYLLLRRCEEKGVFPPLKVTIQEVILINGTEDSKGKEGRMEEKRERRKGRRE